MNDVTRMLTLIALSTIGASALYAQQNDTSAIRLPMTLDGDQRTELYARVEGYVAEVHADIGDRVTKGQLLVSLDAP